MDTKYEQSRPSVPATLRREAEVEAGHTCSVAHCSEHTYLELHHIDGNRENNFIENLILLCPKHHRMAEAEKIDRKALREYKRLNREKLTQPTQFKLSREQETTYLSNLTEWLNDEITRMESSPFPNKQQAHIQPSFKISGQIVSSFELEKLLDERSRVLLLGNGGSGKTVTLLNWLKKLIETLDHKEDPLPVYISLGSLTVKSDLSTLIRASLGKHSISIGQAELEILLLQGRLLILLDGINEINQNAVEQGAVDDLFNFVDLYPSTTFVASSRYIDAVQQHNFQTIEIIAWTKDSIRNYLHARLGVELGETTFQNLGDELDFEWLSGSSVAGFCSNPLTLWMLATTVEGKGQPPTVTDNLVDEVVNLMIHRLSETQRNFLSNTLLSELLQEFAYQMLDEGEIFSVQFDKATQIADKIVRKRDRIFPLPKKLDAYNLLTVFITTGLLRRNGDQIEWLHQVLQENLSTQYAAKRFAKFFEICNYVTCPYCGYRIDAFYEDEGKLYGVCEETNKEFVIQLPNIPQVKKFRRKIKFIDRTDLPHHPGQISIPNSYVKQRYMAYLPMSGVLYTLLLGHIQNDTSSTPLDRNQFEQEIQVDAKPLFDLEVWALIEAGLIELRHQNNVTTAYIYLPSVNPAATFTDYILVTLRPMTSEELEEDPDERFGVTTEEGEKRRQERFEKNLPHPNYYPFPEHQRSKVFRLAQKFGGQIRRSWGTVEEVIAEFPGEAWDFSKFAAEK